MFGKAWYKFAKLQEEDHIPGRVSDRTCVIRNALCTYPETNPIVRSGATDPEVTGLSRISFSCKFTVKNHGIFTTKKPVASLITIF